MSSLRRAAQNRRAIQLIGAGFLRLAGSFWLHSTARLASPTFLAPEIEAMEPAGNSLQWKIVALVLALSWSLLFAGCQPKAAETTAFGLRIAELKISNVPLTAEIADTPQSSENGLMFRDSLPEDQGMLFIFDQPKRASFWMRNTKIPLSIAFIDSAGGILEIKSMNPLDETLVPSSSDQVAYALEANQGWFARHRISSGAKIDGIPRK